MKGARPIGFVVSGLLHLGIVALFLLPGSRSVESAPNERRVALDLAMFAMPEVVEPQPPDPLPPQPTVAQEPVPEPQQAPAPPEPPAPMVETPTVEPPPPTVPATEPRPRKIAQRPEPKPVVKRATVAEPPTQLATSQPPQPVGTSPANTIVAQQTAPSPVVPKVDLAGLRERYLAELVAAIERRKHYPRQSRRRGEEGTVLVAFVIRSDGRLDDIHISRSSNFDRLDQAALKTLRGLTSFQPIPAALDRDNWPISVPIAFSLR